MSIRTCQLLANPLPHFPAQVPADRDWCGFIGGLAHGASVGQGPDEDSEPSPLYVSTNAGNESAICEALCEGPGTTVRLSTPVSGWSVGAHGWTIEHGRDGATDQFDALVLATGGPTLPAAVVGSLADVVGDGSAGGDGGAGAKTLRVLGEGLREVETAMGEVFIVKLAFDGLDSNRVPFAAAATDSQIVQWIARESSKPGSALRGASMGGGEAGAALGSSDGDGEV